MHLLKSFPYPFVGLPSEELSYLRPYLLCKDGAKANTYFESGQIFNILIIK